jgi:type II secretory pathway component PulF
MPEPSVPAPAPGGLLTAEDLITLNEEIAGMARAGLPLDQGLTALAKDMGRGRLRAVTRQLGDDLRAGLTLPQALDRQKSHVPSYYSALLAAGIRGGRLADVLGTLTLHARSIAEVRSAVVSALLYPTIVLIVAFGLLFSVGYFVVPMMADILQKYRIRLPLIAEVMLFIGSHLLQTVVFPLLFILITILFARWGLRSSRQGRMTWARFVYSVPIVGGLIRSARLAAFTDLLGIMVDKAVPLPEGLRLAAEASSDPLLSEAVNEIERELQQGTPLGKALWRQLLMPELVVWMITFGQERGTLGPALHQIAELYRRKAEARATLLRTILPPLLIVVLAAIMAGTFIFGFLMPFLSVLGGLSGGGPPRWW